MRKRILAVAAVLTCGVLCVLSTSRPVKSDGVVALSDSTASHQDDPRAQALLDVVRHHTFNALPPSQQQRILDTVDQQRDDLRLLASVDQSAYAKVADFVSLKDFAGFSPIHQSLLARVREATKANGARGAMCFAPGTDPAVMEAFETAIWGPPGQRFQQTSRWFSTATDGPGLTQGDPTTLTYSFVPDGTFCPSIIGVTGNSDLFSFLDGIYGNTATWQAIYAQVFARWDELSGLSFVLEPNDDGVNLNGAGGSLGVRGDLRMAGIFIDGNSGTLAYNNFPNDGDMVIDTGDNFYNNTTSQSLRLRNVLAHEHGHGHGELHVCPINQTKLMEPFISLAYDGPQIDDIQNVQRHYGDNLEDNDTAGTASPLGALGDGTITVDDVSSDDNSDVDYYSFSTIAPDRGVTATMRPIGLTYLNGPQNVSPCSAGTDFNSLIAGNLGVEVLDSDGTTVLASATANAAGVNEVAIAGLPAVDTYFIRVVSGPNNTVQLYELDVTIGGPPFQHLSVAYSPAPPATIPPGGAAQFSVEIDPGDEVLIPGSEMVHYRYDGGAFVTVPLTFLGGTSYMALLPAAGCADAPEFFISAEGDVSGVVNNPPAGAASPILAPTGVPGGILFLDNFDSDLGWSVQDVSQSGATVDGTWELGVAAGGGTRGDPLTCRGGSGGCYLTDNLPDNTDVDNGSTILTSPEFNMPYGGTIEFSYWLNDFEGGELGAEDFLSVEVATDPAGTNWTEVRQYLTAANVWRIDTIAVGIEIESSSTIRIRFTAADLSPGDVVEAGVDRVIGRANTCADLEDCMFGPDTIPAPSPPITPLQCVTAYDFDGDDDVDLADSQLIQDAP